MQRARCLPRVPLLDAMGAVLGLIAALAYGASDFVAGIASRRTPVMLVTAVTLVTEFLLALVVLAFVHGAGPTPSAVLWGALSGVGSAVGTLALYQGFAVGSMSIAPWTVPPNANNAASDSR